VIRELTSADAQAVIADLVGAELGLAPAEVVAINAATRLDADGVGVDSLALLNLAASVATFFRLHESELEDELLRRSSVGDWAATVMRAWAHGSRSITFTTSGSSGTPAHCTHRWASIAQELDAQAALFAGRQRVVGLVGPRHIYGFLFCVLLPRWLGVPFVDGRAAAPAGLASVSRPGDLLVGFPMRWDLAASGGRWPEGVTGVTSTGPITAATVAALRQRGLGRMVEVYGSSETGGVAWRDNPADPLQPYPHWSLNPDCTLARTDPDAPGLTHRVEPPDTLSARAGGFDVTGRRDGAVQVAGSNVSCAHVASVLAEHPDIRACTVRLMSAHEGTRLKAFAVVAAGVAEDNLRPALRRWMQARLSTAEVPANIVFGDALPRNVHGKLADWMMQRDQA
jgi:long-chain acyl-CoA synthetase